jgi:ATP-dependent RNA helicase RhlE
VNYELPMVAEDYVHRIGRTGRPARRGDAISLVCVDEAPLLREIEKLLGAPIPSRSIRASSPTGRSARSRSAAIGNTAFVNPGGACVAGPPRPCRSAPRPADPQRHAPGVRAVHAIRAVGIGNGQGPRGSWTNGERPDRGFDHRGGDRVTAR